MNYTLIAYREDWSYYDRCGDFINKPGEHKVIFSQDRSEFAKEYASISYEDKWDELTVLINGKPESHWNDTDQKEADIIEAGRFEHCQRLTEEKERARVEAEKREAERRAQEAIRLAEKQRQADLAQYEELKKKLGI